MSEGNKPVSNSWTHNVSPLSNRGFQGGRWDREGGGGRDETARSRVSPCHVGLRAGLGGWDGGGG